MPTEPRLGSLVCEPLRLAGAARLLSVDVEDWFHANFASLPELATASLPSRVESGVAATLELLAACDARATFFVLGCVAGRHPGLVRRIADAGHEIACHALEHELVHEMSPQRFRAAVGQARERLRDQSGQPVRGFRAPSWSIGMRSLWAFDALVEAGFEYDSSIFPGASPLYGIPGAPTGAYRLRLDGGAALLEVPPSVLALGPLRLGIGGGVYLRALPVRLQRWAMRRYARRDEPFMLYVHPRDLDPTAWGLRLPLSRLDQLIHRVGLRSTPRKLRALLGLGGWQPIGAALEGAGATSAVG